MVNNSRMPVSSSTIRHIIARERGSGGTEARSSWPRHRVTCDLLHVSPPPYLPFSLLFDHYPSASPHRPLVASPSFLVYCVSVPTRFPLVEHRFGDAAMQGLLFL